MSKYKGSLKYAPYTGKYVLSIMMVAYILFLI